MRIEFNQTQEDIISFYQFNYWYSDERKAYRLKIRISWGVIAMTPFWLIILFAPNVEVKSIIGLTLMGLLFFAIGAVSAKPSMLNYWKKVGDNLSTDKVNSELFGLKIMEFTDNKILWSSDTSKGESSADTIKKIKQDNNYFFLYNTSFSAYVIPKHVFKNEEHIKQFETIISNYQSGI